MGRESWSRTVILDYVIVLKRDVTPVAFRQRVEGGASEDSVDDVHRLGRSRPVSLDESANLRSDPVSTSREFPDPRSRATSMTSDSVAVALLVGRHRECP